MALIPYKKYKVSIKSDSKKVQGLRTGDIVRRQYFDGKNTIYSLLCVLSYGVDKVMSRASSSYGDSPYFIGALLEGDPLDGNNPTELFDFARITNLFDENRSGALYLTASDNNAPFMDVIDGIAKNKSLSWPEGLATQNNRNAKLQYVVDGDHELAIKYDSVVQDCKRVLSITRNIVHQAGFCGVNQSFSQNIESPNQVVISYKAKATSPLQSIPASIGYTDDLHLDAQWTENYGTEWEYKFKVVTIEYSGRHLRSFKLDVSTLPIGETIQISDLNIILLSSLSNFGDGSVSRIGQLDGVQDGVFGNIDGYGAYIQKLYASRSVHISGTLTAGDENGFGATFYAGKIHRNCFINSLNVTLLSNTQIDAGDVINPTGTGNVYVSSQAISMQAQSSDWLVSHVGKKYVFSFWIYAKRPCQIVVAQNAKTIGLIEINSNHTHEWRRVHTCFDILSGASNNEPLQFDIIPSFTVLTFDNKDAASVFQDAALFYFTAPQLETGEVVTQYQPTDNQLNYTDEYGAWFNKGGIGGTIQNPLIKFNGDGSISSKNDSFVINSDGSGHFANGRFKWSENTISLTGITIKWEDLDPNAQSELKPKSVKIIGEDTFKISDGRCTPERITLTISPTNFTLNPENITWHYLDVDGNYVIISQIGSSSLAILPGDLYWKGRDTLTIKCVVNVNHASYIDTITIQKSKDGQDAYSVQITTSHGNTFKNGIGSTNLTAHVYKGGHEITSQLHQKDFDWIKTSSDPSSDKIFNASHLGWGNTLTITSEDIWNMAQFDCKVRIN